MAASDYIIQYSAPMCPTGVLANAVGYSATTIVLSAITSVRPGDIVAGMAAMIEDEIVKIVDVTPPTVTVLRGCADTVPAIHQAGSVLWFFDASLGSDYKPYTATETVAVKLLPYSTTGNNIPIEASPPHDIVFGWRANRPYPPALLMCEGSAWYNGVKQMSLGQDTLTWTWVHRDRILQADQLVGHTESSIGPEPGTTYRAEVYDPDGVLLRLETGITGNSWTYTRVMAEGDGFTAAEAYVNIYSERDGLTSHQHYRTEIRVVGGNASFVDARALGWPGTKVNCGVTEFGLENWGTLTWDDLDIAWDDTEASWANTTVSPISYEHPVVDTGVLGTYKITLPYTASGAVVGEVATSTDGVTFTGWAAPVDGGVVLRYIKARWSCTGFDPAFSSAAISYFRRA